MTAVVFANTSGGIFYHCMLLPDGFLCGRCQARHDVPVARCRECGARITVHSIAATNLPPPALWLGAEGAEGMSPADSGLDGAIPLPPDSWAPMPEGAIPDAEWSAQNRRINDLLMGRAQGKPQ